MKRRFILVILCASSRMFSQNVGIDTKNPLQPLHIDGASDNPLSTAPSTVQVANDVVFTTDGKIGVGLLNPITKIDLRGTGNVNNSIGIGETTQTAAVAAAGAVRYSPLNGGKIQFSDGVVWYSLNSNTQKSAIIEKIQGTPSIPYNTPTKLTTWVEYADNTNSFSGGDYIAPRTGKYLLSLSYNFSDTPPPYETGAFAQARVILNNNTATPYARCDRNFGETSVSTMQIGGYCVVGIELKKGDVVSVQILQKINGQSLTLRNDTSASTLGFNNLTINEQ